MVERIDLSTFKKAHEDMVAKNNAAENTFRNWSCPRISEYSFEDIDKIINSGDLPGQRLLSEIFFERNNLYKRLLLYYATLLNYSGLLIPNPSFGKQLSEPHISKRYYMALEFLDRVNFKEIFTRITLKVLTDGCYYGLIQELNKEKGKLVIIDLPATYCRTRLLDLYGNDVVEFNVSYFDSITDQELRELTLEAYPRDIVRFYNRYTKGKTSSSWLKLSSNVGVFFSLTADMRPAFLSVIPATVQYDDAVDTEREKELEEIRKIIVQKIPHLTDGTLLFEPEEALEMHRGAVDMMKGNKNLSILTTYADVDAIISKTTSDNVNNSLEKMLQNVYSEAGASLQLFAPTGTQALPYSVTNDMALMMILGNKYSRYITYIINSLYGNANVDFKYSILALTEYNKSDFIKDSLKLAQSGYSFLLPGIASGLSQRELVNIKDLENKELKLAEKLIPLESSYTQSAKTGEVGAPEKKLEDKAAKTIQNEDAIDRQGGSE